MAAGKSTELTKVAAGPATSDFLAPYEKHGRLRIVSGSYVLAASVAGGGAASGDTIDLFTIPKGARVVAILCNAGGSHGSAQLKVGDSSDDDKYRVQATLTTVGLSIQNSAAAQVGAAVQGVTIPYAADTTIFITVASANFPTGGEPVHWFAVYVVD